MYQVNESVLYGMQGVCKIVEIVKRNFDQKICEYYVLQPVYDEKATIFIPTQSEKLTAKMRHVLTKQEVFDIIREMPEQQPNWIENESARKERYQQILAEGDCGELVKIIKALYLYQQQLQEKGKKLHIADEHFLKDAEKVLYDEFAHVLDMKREQVLPFILDQLEDGGTDGHI